MVKIIVTPRSGENLYGSMIRKELELRKIKRGTLHRTGPKRKGQDEWVHKSFSGRIRIHKMLDDGVVAILSSPKPTDEWQLLNSFIGFIHRHFKHWIHTIILIYEEENG